MHKTLIFVRIWKRKGTASPFRFICNSRKNIFRMIEKHTIEQIAAPYMEEHSLVLVNIKVNKANNIKVFFRAPGRPVNIGDCVALSRWIESQLDRDKEDFSLMVSSAGDSCGDADDEDMETEENNN